MKVFRDWFNDNILSQDSSTMSDAIMIMPYGSANPRYLEDPNELYPQSRDTRLLSKLTGFRNPSTAGSIGERFISPILGIPQLVLPCEFL